MNDNGSRLIVVSSCVLPEIITKVLEVKKLLANREEKSSAAACKRIGISRSAYYKYKDCVFSYEEKLTQKIINISAQLKDEPGVLSSVLLALHSLNANILTLNQSIPVDGVAGITASLRLNENTYDMNEIRSIISEVSGVVEVRILSGE
ncbi:MAG TPA: ACT domain-containing protein [Ruminococcus sp.]|nr:ACT domain-containing protein [Ruminococcus sp.]HBN11437.1 ACT domain-containing protein [Ruminococcus sp.]HCR73970.1 ACT domain-containing protein [Ruminococcus sp.]